MTSWGVPPGFVEHWVDQCVWWLKAEWETAVQEAFTEAASTATAAVSGGRGAVHRVSLGEGIFGIVRHYRRGGFARHFVRTLYWDRPPRPFAELLCTETARQRGVPSVEVLGARVEWVAVGLYRGALITRQAAGCINLWEWLRRRPTGVGRAAVIANVARAVAYLHAAGIEHADLNVTNILVQMTGDSPPALLIDFDRARVFPGPLPHARRARNLRRLRRSLDKLDPGGWLFSPIDIKAFCQAYHQAPSGQPQ